MTVRQPHYSKEEHAQRGNEIYQRQVRPQVEEGHQGKIVAIDIETGAFELAEDALTASNRLLGRYPNAQTWFVRVGSPAVHRFGPRRLASRFSFHFIVVSVVTMLAFLSLYRIANESALARPFVAADKIAFTHQTFIPDLTTNIYVIDADGANLTQLTNTGKDSAPTWSPNGKQLAFTSGRNRGGSNAWGQIYVMNADGTNQHPLSDGFEDRDPDWAPDGKTIVFVRGGNIFLMNSDGSDPRQLTNNPLPGMRYPSFSPDGKKIVFLGSRQLHIMNSDGSGVSKLPLQEIQSQKPSWSPDGKWIAFVGFIAGGQAEILRIKPDGVNMVNLTNHPAIDSSPTWLPDGKQIAFVSNRGGGAGIYLMNSDGGDVVKLMPPPFKGTIIELSWYIPRNLAVDPHQTRFTTWGQIKGMFLTK